MSKEETKAPEAQDEVAPKNAFKKLKKPALTLAFIAINIAVIAITPAMTALTLLPILFLLFLLNSPIILNPPT